MGEKITAIHDEDLFKLFEEWGILNKFSSGQFNCTFCKDKMTLENLHSFFPDSGAIKFTCIKPECIKALMTRMEGRQYGTSV